MSTYFLSPPDSSAVFYLHFYAKCPFKCILISVRRYGLLVRESKEQRSTVRVPSLYTVDMHSGRMNRDCLDRSGQETLELTVRVL